MEIVRAKKDGVRRLEVTVSAQDIASLQTNVPLVITLTSTKTIHEIVIGTPAGLSLLNAR